MKKTLKYGLLVLLLVCTAAFSAGAVYEPYKNIEVFTGVAAYVDGEPVSYVYDDGTIAEVFLSGGVTYMPLRAVAEAVGFEIEWDGANMIARLTSRNVYKPENLEAYMELTAFSKDAAEWAVYAAEYSDTIYSEAVILRFSDQDMDELELIYVDLESSGFPELAGFYAELKNGYADRLVAKYGKLYDEVTVEVIKSMTANIVSTYEDLLAAVPQLTIIGRERSSLAGSAAFDRLTDLTLKVEEPLSEASAAAASLFEEYFDLSYAMCVK